MSYDLILFRAGDDPRAEEDGPEHSPRDPAIERVKRKIADALIARFPDLSEHVFDFDEIAKLHKMPVPEARERFRYVELTDLSPGGGLQITLFDTRASVTVPFWYEGDAARTHFQRVWECIDLICGEANYEAFDPQLDRVISQSAFDDVLACYTQATTRVRNFARPMARRPWWKFW